MEATTSCNRARAGLSGRWDFLRSGESARGVRPAVKVNMSCGRLGSTGAKSGLDSLEAWDRSTVYVDILLIRPSRLDLAHLL